MADSFLDSPIPDGYFFRNAPNCRTRREAANLYVQNGHWEEPHPDVDKSAPVLHQIEHPFTDGAVTARLVVQNDSNTIQKAIRIRGSNLAAEKCRLDLLRENTTVPVPHVHTYFQSQEFEHLIMDKIAGTTLEKAWPNLSINEREAIADEVVGYIQQMRTLKSPTIDATHIGRHPISPGLKDSEDLSMERTKSFPQLPQAESYIRDRSKLLRGQPNVLTHGDLDWSNIIISEKQVSAIIDLEMGGFFPPFWEWLSVKTMAQHSTDDGSWPRLLERRLAREKQPEWDGMWEVEQLISALSGHAQWRLTPEEREENRVRGWERVSQILGADMGEPPTVTYNMATIHPMWLEKVDVDTGQNNGN